MTLDELIAKLQELRQKAPGDTLVLLHDGESGGFYQGALRPAVVWLDRYSTEEGVKQQPELWRHFPKPPAFVYGMDGERYDLQRLYGNSEKVQIAVIDNPYPLLEGA